MSLREVLLLPSVFRVKETSYYRKYEGGKHMDKIDRIISTILVIVLSILTGLLFMSFTVYLFGMEDILDKILMALIGTGISTLVWDKIFIED